MEIRRQPSMTDLLAQMLSLPMAGFFYGMDWMVRTLRDVQGASAAGLSRTIETFPGTGGTRTYSQEDGRMLNRNQDLSGDDLKLVRYTILFVKRDYEAFLYKDDELVAGDMDGGTFAALKVKDYLIRADKGEVKRPVEWGGGYGEKTPTGFTIPDNDQKYIRVYYEVLERYPRQEKEYEKQQVQVLREISSKIG